MNFMDYYQWNRDDIIRHHAAALSFLKRISAAEPSESKTKKYSKGQGRHHRTHNVERNDQPYLKEVSTSKKIPHNDKSQASLSDSLNDLAIQKYVENTQKKKMMSISKESYSDNLFLLRYRAGELYDNEISYGHMLSNKLAKPVTKPDNLKALVLRPNQSIMLFSNAYKMNSQNIDICDSYSNQSVPKVKTKLSDQPNFSEKDIAKYHHLNHFDYLPTNSISPKKFFRNEINAFDEMLADLKKQKLPIKNKEIIPLRVFNNFPKSNLLQYSEDFYERLHAHSFNTSSFLHTSHKFEKEMKKKINDEFHKQFPSVNITLTKFISLKREMKKVVITECKMDPIILAHAFCYFDKLVTEGWTNKYNRKICCSLCITFAAKMHDIKGDYLSELFEELENTFRLDKKEILLYEMPCLIALEFSLHLSAPKVLQHYDKIMSQIDGSLSSK